MGKRIGAQVQLGEGDLATLIDDRPVLGIAGGGGGAGRRRVAPKRHSAMPALSSRSGIVGPSRPDSAIRRNVSNL